MSTGDPIELTAQVGATVEKQAKQGSSDATAVNGRVDVKLGVADKSAAHEGAIAGQSLDDTAVQSTLVRTVPEKSLSDSGKPETSSTETAADTPPATTPTISGHVRAQHTSETHVATSVVVPVATGQSTSTDATEVAHQIGRHIASTRLSGLARDRPMHLSVLLHPEDLGEVSVQLTLVAGRIDVQVSSQSDTTRDMLRQGMQDLRRQLSDSGVAVGDTDVRDGWSQQQNSSQNDQRTADQRSSQQPRLPGLPAPSSSRMTTPEPTLVHRPSRTGLDILA
jgi:flagellar hook-length control protein FliK